MENYLKPDIVLIIIHGKFELPWAGNGLTYNINVL